jgi:tetratricopeptide (TPR) repeat protein
LTRQGEAVEAIAVLKSAIVYGETLYRRHHDFAHAGQLSSAYANLAQAQGFAHGRNGPLAAFQEAVANSRKSLEILESAGAQPDESWQVSLASRHFRVGYALNELGDRTGEVSYHREALEIQLKGDAVMRTLSASNPKRPHRRELADDLISIGLSRWSCCRDLDGALRDDREALKMFEQLAKEDPDNLEARRDVANTYMTGGEILGKAGRRPEALNMYRKAEAVYEGLRRADPASAENVAFLAEVRTQVAALEQGR